MGGKFAVFFLVAVCLVQGYQSHVVQPRGVIDDIVNSITKVIDKMKNTMVNTASQISDIISNMSDKTNVIFEQLNLDELKQQISNEIDDAVDNVIAVPGLDPDVVRDCMIAKDKAVKKFIFDTVDGYDSCRKSAENEIRELAQEMDELTARATALFGNSAEAIKKCISDNGINIIGTSRCLTAYLAKLTTDATALAQQFTTVLITAEEKKITTISGAVSCIATQSANVVKGKIEIIANIQKCVGAESN